MVHAFVKELQIEILMLSVNHELPVGYSAPSILLEVPHVRLFSWLAKIESHDIVGLGALDTIVAPVILVVYSALR